MARTRNNMITQSYSGKVGNICLQRDGVIRKLPDMSKRVLTEKQKGHLKRFQLAKAYARKVLADEALAAHYADFVVRWKKKKKNIGLYHVAIMDFMNPPEINKIGVEKNGRWVIHADVADIFLVAGVSVAILFPGGAITEEGEAVKNEYLPDFIYVVKDPTLIGPGATIRIKAHDFPGNCTEKEFPC